MYSYSVFEQKNDDISSQYIEQISKDFRVFLEGKEIPVYTCRISKDPINSSWPGYQRPIHQTEFASYVNLVSDEPITLDVLIEKEYEKVMLRPYSKGIEFKEEGKKVSFTLEKEGQFVLATDNLSRPLYIFNSKPIPAPEPDSVTYYFGPGVHFASRITLRDNESVYVDKDAHVFGNIFAIGAENLRVFGNGILDGSTEERVSAKAYGHTTVGNCRFMDCRNVAVTGVGFMNSATWCVTTFGCDGVDFKNIKVFGQWRYNTDGMDIVNSRNVTIKDSFIHSFDDSIVLKGLDRYITVNDENIHIDNCILWCDWGRTLEIGFETACRMYKNISFRNCDIIRAGHTAIDIQNGDCAEVSDVLYENINVEYNSFDRCPYTQKNYEDRYEDVYDGAIMVPFLIKIANISFRDTYNYPPMAPLDLTGVQVGTVHDISYKNINVYYDEKIPRKDGKYNMPIAIESIRDGVEHYNISVSGIKVNGKKMTESDLDIRIKNANNVSFHENTVDAKNQLSKKKFVSYINPDGKGKRVLLLGNSIMLHGVKEDIGWHNAWGMAASAQEKDYVHQLISKIEKTEPDAVYCLCQVSEWESRYMEGTETFKNYEAARDFGADIIIGRLIDNCRRADFDAEVFEKEFGQFLDFLNSKNTDKIAITTGFWAHPGNETLEKIAKDKAYTFVPIHDLGDDPEMKAIGLFEHNGVQSHPGDKGMKEIADRIWKKINKWF